MESPTYSDGAWRDEDGMIVCKCGKPAPLSCDECDECFSKRVSDFLTNKPKPYRTYEPLPD